MAIATMTDAPITRQDRIRASYFGLRLPVAVEAPAPAPIKVEPARGDTWMGETVSILITSAAVELVEAGAAQAETDHLFDALDLESKADFRTFLDSIGCPSITWGEWLTRCFGGSPVAFEIPDPEPLLLTWWDQVRHLYQPEAVEVLETDDGFIVTPELDAERVGYVLGNAGVSAAPPADLAPSCRASFLVGLEAGRLDLEDETLEDHQSLEQRDRERGEVLAGPVAHWHEAELCEARSGSGYPSLEE